MMFTWLLLLAFLSGAETAAPADGSAPAAEQLTYNVNWPTGLSLGEARLRTTRAKSESGERVETDFSIDAAIPGFQVLDRYHAVADSNLCSTELSKSYKHGKRSAEETTQFDQSNKVATRQTKDGGKSEIAIQSCAKDALTYLQYLRNELNQGRLPPHQVVLFGAEYRVSVQFAGTEPIVVSEKRIDADRLNVTVKGPATDITFQAYFAKDPARTPLLVKIPLSLATFSVELVR
jgi:hypothetical protein